MVFALFGMSTPRPRDAEASLSVGAKTRVGRGGRGFGGRMGTQGVQHLRVGSADGRWLSRTWQRRSSWIYWSLPWSRQAAESIALFGRSAGESTDGWSGTGAGATERCQFFQAMSTARSTPAVGPPSRLGVACAYSPHRSSESGVSDRHVPASATPSSDTRTTSELTNRPL